MSFNIFLEGILMAGIGIWQLLIVAVIVVLLFGTKKLRNLGGDLGSAIKGFKSEIEDKSEVAESKIIESITETSSDEESVVVKEKGVV